jgi:hypothetical protein
MKLLTQQTLDFFGMVKGSMPMLIYSGWVCTKFGKANWEIWEIREIREIWEIREIREIREIWEIWEMQKTSRKHALMLEGR